MKLAIARLSVLAVLSGVLNACSESRTLLSAQLSPQVRQAIFVVGYDTLALTYLCGNTFRLRTTHQYTQDTSFSWSTALPETGTVEVYKALPGRPYSEGYITVASSDSVQIVGYAGLKEGNGGAPACAVTPDTTWPTASSLGDAYSYVDRSEALAGASVEDSVNSRAARITAESGVPRDSLARVLFRFGARVVGQSGILNTLTIRFDQRRNTYAAYLAVLDSLQAHPAIRTAARSYRTSRLEVRTSGRSLVDSSLFCSLQLEVAKQQPLARSINSA